MLHEPRDSIQCQLGAVDPAEAVAGSGGVGGDEASTTAPDGGLAPPGPLRTYSPSGLHAWALAALDEWIRVVLRRVLGMEWRRVAVFRLRVRVELGARLLVW
jgi:hypothetical protein